MTQNRSFIFWHITLGAVAMTALPIALLVNRGANAVLLLGMVLGFVSILLACRSHQDHQPWLERASLGFSLLLIGCFAFFSAPFSPALWLLMVLPLQAHFLFQGRLLHTACVVAGVGLLFGYGLGFKMVHLDSLELNFAGLVVAMLGLGLCTYCAKILIEGARYKHLGKLPSGVLDDSNLKKSLDDSVDEKSELESVPLSQRLRKIQPIPAQMDKNTVYLDHSVVSNIPQSNFKELTRFDGYTDIDECISKLEVLQSGFMEKSA